MKIINKNLKILNQNLTLDEKLKHLLNLYKTNKISYDDYQKELNKIFGNSQNLGVISQIEDYLNESVPLSDMMWQRSNGAIFHENKKNEYFLKRCDWEIIFFNMEPTPINADIKADIVKLFDRLLKPTISQTTTIRGYNAYLFWLLRFDHTLNYFLHRTEMSTKDKIYKIIKAYYEFLRAEVTKRGFNIMKPFDVPPESRFKDAEYQTKIKRPTCPDCGGKVFSSGINWVCKVCGRNFRKRRTRRRAK